MIIHICTEQNFSKFILPNNAWIHKDMSCSDYVQGLAKVSLKIYRKFLMILCLIYHPKHTKAFKNRKVYDVNLFTFGLFMIGTPHPV